MESEVLTARLAESQAHTSVHENSSEELQATLAKLESDARSQAATIRRLEHEDSEELVTVKNELDEAMQHLMSSSVAASRLGRDEGSSRAAHADNSAATESRLRAEVDSLNMEIGRLRERLAATPKLIRDIENKVSKLQTENSCLRKRLRRRCGSRFVDIALSRDRDGAKADMVLEKVATALEAELKSCERTKELCIRLKSQRDKAVTMAVQAVQQSGADPALRRALEDFLTQPSSSSGDPRPVILREVESFRAQLHQELDCRFDDGPDMMRRIRAVDDTLQAIWRDLPP